MDIHKEFPRTVDRDDFWRQIKRTVNGEPVSENDIQRIVSTITAELELAKFPENAHLLDLGCGNAALASYLFPTLSSYTGVDFSEYLIDVAKEFFLDSIVEDYYVGDILEYVNRKEKFSEYTHVLCYGVMSYLPKSGIETLFKAIKEKMPNVNRVFIGNLPEKSRASDFYANRGIENVDLEDNQTPIGVWWEPAELSEIASSTGWRARVSKMPSDFYASEYRFDVTLERIE